MLYFFKITTKKARSVAAPYKMQFETLEKATTN